EESRRAPSCAIACVRRSRGVLRLHRQLKESGSKMNALGSGNAAAKVPRVPTRASDRPFLPGLPEPEWQYGDNPGQPVIRRLSELRHHASYVRLRLTVPASKLSALAEQGELAFREPLAITRERIVIDGYARWELARLKRRLVL